MNASSSSRRRRRPTAAFCANDLIAIGLLQHLTQAGIDVPGELAIIGYDDIEFAGAAAVPLSTIRQHRELLGHTATELLLAETRTNEEHVHRAGRLRTGADRAHLDDASASKPLGVTRSTGFAGDAPAQRAARGGGKRRPKPLAASWKRGTTSGKPTQSMTPQAEESNAGGRRPA